MSKAPYKKIKAIIDENTGCIIHSHSKEYGSITRNGKWMSLTRWVFYLNYKYLPKEVMHICDNPQCINPLHLVGGNHLDNLKDMQLKGRQAKGKQIANTKLNKIKAKKIKELLKKGESHRNIAKKFGISHGTVENISLKKAWRYV